MRSISRVVDVSINTIAKLLVDAGRACAAFHDDKVRGLMTERVQVDEIWSFTAAKQKNVPDMLCLGRIAVLGHHAGRKRPASAEVGHYTRR